MYVTVQLEAQAAQALQRGDAASPAADEVERAVAELGMVLEPLTAGVADSTLATFFKIEVADAAAAERAVSRLRRCAATVATYVKPADSPPERPR